jgi:membrane-associated protease RseP (regulator of RpoE activity)
MIQMTRRRLIASGVAGLVVTATAVLAARPAPQSSHLTAPVTIPFESVTRHIVLDVVVNDRPLSFVFDTGDKLAIIDLDRAKEMGLALGGAIRVGGVGAKQSEAAFLKDARFALRGLAGFSQPLTLATPLAGLAARFGHEFDGILGSDFIQAFVVEIDYSARTMTLHDRSTFKYTGPGESLPIGLNAAGHPIVAGVLTPLGGSPISGSFAFDMGAGGSLSLHSPFVRSHHLPGRDAPTIRLIGAGGAGGAAAGRVGRSAAFQIGAAVFKNVPTMFSQDTSGAFADAATAGNIGAIIISRFKVFLDYTNRRIILEPAASFADPFDRASSGLSLRAEGHDFKTFEIDEVLENSPASDAGLRVGDVITSIDARPASALTLTAVYELFERAQSCQVTIRRGDETVTVTLTPRILV